MESLPPVDRADEIYKDQYMLMGGFYMLWHYLSSIQVGLIIQKTLFIVTADLIPCQNHRFNSPPKASV
jgi:hypothetical protein